MRRLPNLLLDEQGGTLAEFAMVIGFLFMLGIATFEFTRFFTQLAMAEYATQIAVRRAAVRPAVCPGVPDDNVKVTGNTARYGTMCSDPSAPCVVPAAATCTGTAGNAVVDEIFAVVGPLLPPGSAPANLQFRYEPSGLGFVGGPYIPIVSVGLVNTQHDFIMPLGAMFAPWSGGGGGGNATFNLPPFTATMPGEDINLGTNG